MCRDATPGHIRPGSGNEGIMRMRRSVWGGVAALALVGAGLTAGAAGASAVVLVGGGADDCTPGAASGARVPDGHSIKSDPNSLSAPQVAARAADFSKQRAKLGYDKSSSPRLDDGSQRIKTIVHVIRRNNRSGNTTNKQVRRQIRVMNNAFSGDTAKASVNTPFRFRIKDIQRTNDTDLYNWDIQDDDTEAKDKLHRGGFRTLNLYVAKLDGGLLGYATFPTANDKRLFLDGIVVTKESLPGGSAAPYNKGDTATHEAGHWLNLYHTFQGGCSDPGDYVVDTPRQRAGSNVFRCNPDLNTCGNNDGSEALRDPVHNFMNYTDDKCMNRFTRGQEDRMELSWLAYRKGQ